MPKERPPPDEMTDSTEKGQRMTVYKTLNGTLAHGFELVDGEMVPRVYQLTGLRRSEKRAEQDVKAEHPKFVLSHLDYVRMRYRMNDGMFIEHAELISVDDYDLKEFVKDERE